MTSPPSRANAALRTATLEHADCCIVGAGPAGAVLALLLARQGVSVALLEGHEDFDRDFRGDALQPAPLDVLGQMGLADRVLDLALAQHATFPLHTPSETVAFFDVSGLKTPFPFIAMVPQARFLQLVTEEASRCSTFRLAMGARVEALVEDQDGRVSGVRYCAHDGWHEVRAQVVVGADGRFSRVRSLAGLEPIRTAPPFDLLWFRLPREASDAAGGVYLGSGQWLALLNRGDAWQVAYSLPKGGYQALRAAGLDELRRSVRRIVPWLADRTSALQDWNQAALLAVEVSHPRQWYRPGLLLLGDAAHTMSPVAGVGIGLAIQDAAEAANVLAPRLRAGRVAITDLAEVQRRREWAVRLVQAYQGVAQSWLLASQRDQAARIPIALRVQARVPLLRDLAARIFELGVRPVRLSASSGTSSGYAAGRSAQHARPSA
jgi:2-polyprenyl-6-methoxyphenol hydroxylase-like FAD-dependent oxidoreductase